jgi:hypothetical protein
MLWKLYANDTIGEAPLHVARPLFVVIIPGKIRIAVVREADVGAERANSFIRPERPNQGPSVSTSRYSPNHVEARSRPLRLTSIK